MTDDKKKIPKQRAALVNENEQLKKEYTNLRSQYERLTADFLNLQRRAQHDQVSIKVRTEKDLLLSILPMLDDLYRSLTHMPKINEKPTPQDISQIQSFLSGISMLVGQIENITASLGLKRIKTIGEVFDPSLHEAITSNISDFASDTIIDEIESGWIYRDEVLRPAKVIVSK